MIVLNVTYKCLPEKRGEFLERIVAEGIDEASRGEEGNIQYDYFIPLDGGDELLLVEKWRDEAALSAHSAQPHFKRLGELKPVYVSETAIERYSDRQLPEEAPAGDYDNACRRMLEFRESFKALGKADQERLVKAAVPVWAPNADPLKTKFIVSTITKLLG